MPSREPELYKDKIEVSLDGRQIFYLFFGGAVIVGMVFVLGVIIGRRVEARGHLERAQTQTANDPLAALDRLEHPDNLSFHGALTGSDAPTDVEAAIGELGKRRAGKADKKSEPPAGPAVAGDGKPGKPEVKPETRPEARAETRPEVKPESISRPDPDKPRSDKHDGEKKPKKHDDGAAGEGRSDGKPERSDARRADARGDRPVTRPEASADGRAEPKSDGKPDARSGGDAKGRFTLQLSSFQDRGEAEAFLTAMKSAGYQPYLTEADVSGKGTFYRVRLGSYRSLEAANDAKAEYEKAAKKTAQVMRL
jgi:DedD protein